MGIPRLQLNKYSKQSCRKRAIYTVSQKNIPEIAFVVLGLNAMLKLIRPSSSSSSSTVT